MAALQAMHTSSNFAIGLKIPGSNAVNAHLDDAVQALCQGQLPRTVSEALDGRVNATLAGIYPSWGAFLAAYWSSVDYVRPFTPVVRERGRVISLVSRLVYLYGLGYASLAHATYIFHAAHSHAGHIWNALSILLACGWQLVRATGGGTQTLFERIKVSRYRYICYTVADNMGPYVP